MELANIHVLLSNKTMVRVWLLPEALALILADWLTLVWRLHYSLH